MTKFRISNHKLRIETGRYEKPKIDRCDRTCRLCLLNNVEDESHFIFDCPFYKFERHQFYEIVTRRLGRDLALTPDEWESQKPVILSTKMNSGEHEVLTASTKEPTA